MYCVYCHTNKINGKRYIGQTKLNPIVRWGENGEGYHSQYFGRAISKYGWNNFEHIILKDNLTQTEANYFEKLFIEQFKTTNPQYGYNISAGGEHWGPTIPWNKGKKTGQIPWNKTRKYSKESIQKMSKSQKQRYTDIEQRNISSKVNKGRISITNGKINRRVWEYELQSYLDQGYIIGSKQKASLGKKWVNNGISETYINIEDLDAYTNIGYILGRLKRT